ncbi:MAG TPA: hypothetical protein VMH31_06340 [Methylomirabilota bacterium]|nr:hypothetical protein [Methylomirabilota bacterium]
MKTAILSLVAFCTLTLPSHAQTRPSAFGFQVGSTKDEILAAAGGSAKLRRADGTTLYLKSSADPAANKLFNEFKLVVTPKLGLSSVTGIVPLSSATPFAQVRRQYKSLRDSIAAEYGPPRREFDLVRTGSTATSDEQAFKAFAQKTRHLASYWLLDDKTLVAVRVVGISSARAQLILKYEFRPDYESLKTEEAVALPTPRETSGK